MNKSGYCTIIYNNENKAIKLVVAEQVPEKTDANETIYFHQKCDDVNFIMEEMKKAFEKRKIKKSGDYFHVSTYSAIVTLDSAITQYCKMHQKWLKVKNDEKQRKIAKKTASFPTYFNDEK